MTNYDDYVTEHVNKHVMYRTIPYCILKILTRLKYWFLIKVKINIISINSIIQSSYEGVNVKTKRDCTILMSVRIVRCGVQTN